MEQRKNRLPEISVMSVMLCLLVIFIHVSSAPITGFNKTGFRFAVVFIPWRLSAFVVQGFIFLSAVRLFLSHPEGLRYRSFYLGRLTRIILPYVVWNLIYYVFFVIKGYFPFSLTALLGYVVSGELVSPFYFVVAIAQFYALAPLWFLMVRHRSSLLMLCISAVVTLLSFLFLPKLLSHLFHGYVFAYNDRVFTTYLLYWIAGCYVGANYEKARSFLVKRCQTIVVLFVVVATAEGLISYTAFSGRKMFTWLELLHFFYCVTAVLFTFTVLAQVYTRRTVRTRLVLKIDQASYSIYLSHCLVIFLVNDIMKLFGLTDLTLAYGLRIITVYTVTLTCCILWNKAYRHIFLDKSRTKAPVKSR